ncbi:DUF4249 family protein [Roseivirga pacifica]|uniref:DUF4249 family protein n=1 Tax=Roseivirga pacifica TaxID=1267423 RepID=UPI003BB0EA93
MQKKYIFIYALALMLMAVGCTQVIDLDTDEVGGKLVIFGRVSNSSVGNTVTVTRTQPNGEDPLPIENARVLIFDQQDNAAQLNYIGNGIYELPHGVLNQQVGSQFRLEVNIDGATYTSPLQQMPELVGQDEVSWERIEHTTISSTGVTVVRDAIRVTASTNIYNKPNEFFLRWHVEETYPLVGASLPNSHFPFYTPMVCYAEIPLNQQEIMLLDGTEVRPDFIAPREMAIRFLDYTFDRKHYFSVIQSSITKEAHEYWSRVNTITARSGSIFDIPPASVPGNITSSDPNENVLGFFEVIALDTARTLVTNDDLNIFFERPCQTTGSEMYRRITSVPYMCPSCLVDEKILPEVCIFCDRQPYHSQQRPSYFE